jgi:hypothetical protein
MESEIRLKKSIVAKCGQLETNKTTVWLSGWMKGI